MEFHFSQAYKSIFFTKFNVAKENIDEINNYYKKH